jgi:Ca2+-transporting ATPase
LAQIIHKKGAAWHADSFSEALSRLSVDLSGLSPALVEKRRRELGGNVLEKTDENTFLKRLIKQVVSPLVLILLAAGFLTLFLGQYFDSTVIFIALLVNVAIGLLQEGRASKAFEKLSSSQEVFAEVVRDGKRKVVKAVELVPGDLVVIEQGTRVPGDLRLIKTNSLEVDEAVLTGESSAVFKDEGAKLSKETIVAERVNMAFMGTVVSGGFGKGVVVATGKDTELGKIAQSLSPESATETPTQRNMKKLAKFLLVVVIAVIIVIFALGILRGEPIADLVLLSIAVAVSVVPEGIPAAVTAVLAVGMERILKKGGLVRNLLAAETLGATTVILTDKTGTLTKADMKLETLFSSSGSFKLSPGVQPSEDMRKILYLGTLASDAFIEEGDDGDVVRGRPLERALLEAGLAIGLDQRKVLSEDKRIDYMPFQSANRFEASLHEKLTGEGTLVLSGSPEKILSMSGKVLEHGKVHSLTKEKREHFDKVVDKNTEHGMRFIAVAYEEGAKELNKETVGERENDPNITFAGIFAFSDPVREDVKEAISTSEKAGARIIMLTGDHPGTALFVAKEVGIKNASKGVVTGAEIAKLSDEELRGTLKEISVFARMAPQDKLRMAKILREDGETLAMTGDGVNDAPALRFASIGIAVESGTEVAKEASDLILLKNSFAIIVYAIEEGRRIIDNLKKVVTHLLSTGFGEVFVIVGAMVFGLPLPILPVQILWLNIIEEGLLNFAFAFEPAEKDVMARKPQARSLKTTLAPEIKNLIFTVGAVTGLLAFAIFVILERSGVPIDEVRTMVFIMLSLNALFFTFAIKNFRTPVFKTDLFSNRFLLFAFGINFLLIFLTLLAPPIRNLLSLTLLSSGQVLFLVAAAIVNLGIIETAKHFIFRKEKMII